VGLKLWLYFPDSYGPFTVYANELTGEASIKVDEK
jgi:hypothetical protein